MLLDRRRASIDATRGWPSKLRIGSISSLKSLGVGEHHDRAVRSPDTLLSVDSSAESGGTGAVARPMRRSERVHWRWVAVVLRRAFCT